MTPAQGWGNETFYIPGPTREFSIPNDLNDIEDLLLQVVAQYLAIEKDSYKR